jgi:hypothetical protein
MTRGSSYSKITAVTIILAVIGPVGMAIAEQPATNGIGPIQRSIRVQDWTIELQRARALGQRQPIHQMGPNRASRKVIWGLIGVAAGAFVGYQVGNLLDHNDPDHYGGIIFGIPIGAVAGGVMGVWVVSR